MFVCFCFCFKDILCIIFQEQLEDGLFIKEAIKQGVIYDRQWFVYDHIYGSSFQWPSGLDERNQFVEFYNNTGWFNYKTMIEEDDSTIYDMLPPTIDTNWTHFTPGNLFSYEAVIMLGLAACNAAEINLNTNTLSCNKTNENLYLDTPVLYKKLVNMEITSRVTGDLIRLNNITGTREPATAHFVLSNMLIRFYGEENNTNKLLSMETVKKYDFFGGRWKLLNPFIYKNGSTIPISDLQPVDEQPIFFNKVVLSISYSLFTLTVMSAIGFISWTMINRKTKIVNASQPFFLYMIGKLYFVFGAH